MAVFACTPSLSGSGTGLIGVHADGSVTDLGSYSIDFGSPTDWISTLHDGKLYYVPGSGDQAETIEVTDLAAQTTETLPLPAGGGWNNYCVAYGDGTIGLISNEINHAWTPGSDTAIELAPTWCKDTAVALLSGHLCREWHDSTDQSQRPRHSLRRSLPRRVSRTSASKPSAN